MYTEEIARSRIVFILGDDCHESLCRHLHEGFENTAFITASDYRSLCEKIQTFFNRGARMFFVCGYPLTKEDAEHVVAHFPHIVTFSIEGSKTIDSPVNRVKRELAKRGQVHIVSPKGNPLRFIQNRIVDLLRGNKITNEVVKSRTLSAA